MSKNPFNAARTFRVGELDSLKAHARFRIFDPFAHVKVVGGSGSALIMVQSL